MHSSTAREQGVDDAVKSSRFSLHVLTLNCWGLKYLSKYREERLAEIGRRIATFEPPLDIVGLQECWTYADYTEIRKLTRSVLPHAKFYHSGIFGGGLVLLSRYPIIESSMFRYPLNGRPTAFFRGDWFVGKGVACTKIQLPDGTQLEVFNTHLHAPYELNDSYLCHRTAQAWEIAKLMKAAREKGNLVLGLGDFNMVPMSFAHVLIESKGDVQDAWRMVHPTSSIGASIDRVEADRRSQLKLAESPDVKESLHEHGHTCDSVVNTWRWNEAHRKDLDKGYDREISMDTSDPRAKRLDYVFFGGSEHGWQVQDIQVALTERHPTLRCSLSDHFAVEATLVQEAPVSSDCVNATLQKLADNNETGVNTDRKALKLSPEKSRRAGIEASIYERILDMIDQYTLRERKQRRWRMGHFLGSAVFSIGSFVAVWWSRYNYVAFILLLISTLGLMAGTIDGLIGGLFVGSELRALNEFEWEVRNALALSQGRSTDDTPLLDWYDN